MNYSTNLIQIKKKRKYSGITIVTLEMQMKEMLCKGGPF